MIYSDELRENALLTDKLHVAIGHVQEMVCINP